MRAFAVCLSLLMSLSMPCAHAAWHAANPIAAEAVKHPRIAAALAASARFDTAILGHDAAVFGDTFTDDAVVNNPFDTIARKADAIHNASGLRPSKLPIAQWPRLVET